jgi:polar amino acid transport system ATP-binding protein
MKLEFRKLTKRFGNRTVLDDLVLAVDFECLALIGPSGGGKSTLLRLIAGLVHPDAGAVALDGREINYEEEALRAHRRSLGIVFQSFNLFSHLTALENVRLPLEKVHGQPPSEALETAQESLRRFGLEMHADHLPAHLSGGQRQRVAIARALAIRPRLLIFDEPTSALDPEMTVEVLKTIEEVRAAGGKLIVVTHHMGFARRISDQTVFLAGGRIVESGPSSRVFGSPESLECRQFLSTVLRY